jgi:phosphatidate cytidylyltransferase
MPQARRAGSKPRRRSELLARIVVAVPAAVIAVVFDDIGGVGWMVLMALLALACLNELYAMLPAWRPVSLVGFLVAAGMCVAARYGTLTDVVGAAMAGVPLVFLALLLRGETSGATYSITSTLLGIYWIGFAFAHAVLLRQIPNGAGLLIDVMVGTFLGDTAAYLGGRLFGRHPLAPTISPNKTVEGLACGVLVSILAVVVAGLYQESWLPHGTALLLGIAVAVVSPIGDLFESLIKRDAGTKDAGRMFGAHGGALDRLDSVMFTVVVAYYIGINIPR